ncbi:MAG: RecQ family ATP-dependent DNA helicase [Flavobacteriales bacterium]|nr:RecQ family ATP-dependent DNA helicase [Flavobacteriales bacterium]
MNPIDILIKYWGHTKFRSKQELIIDNVLNQKDVLALLPTGGGKSVCYQIPALIKEGVCIVISPLISLMQDQVKHLKSKCIKSVSISSSMSYSQTDTALTNCIYGGIKFLFLSPEKLKNNLVISRIKEMTINLIAIDEAHCISEWGHNFRPAYRKISEFREILPDVSILALTATANSNVIDDIQKTLKFNSSNIIKSSLIRPKLSYVVDDIIDKRKRLIKLLNKIKSSVIIYVDTRRKSEEISLYLNNEGFTSSFYHAGVHPDDRTKRQLSWSNNETRIIVATNSFGMGIDKPDVKLVVHMHMPSSIESYFQEAGRAGRNGETAFSFLLANKNDITKQENLLQTKYPDIKDIINIYQNISSYLQIAVGDNIEEYLAFDIEKFAKRYGHSTLQVYYSIKYLEKEELLKFSDENFSKSRFKFIKTNNELYKFQISNRYFDSFIRVLLRTYSNAFNNFVTVDIISLAKKTNSNTDNILILFNKLKELEIIDFQEENNDPKIEYLRERLDLNINFFNKDKLESWKYFDTKKLNFISSYILNKSLCRSSMLLKYFGEIIDEDCGVCDVCIIKKRNSI